MTKDDIIKLAREAGLFVHKEVQPELVAFANLVAAQEREECAKVCEETYDLFVSKKPSRASALDAADAIRARTKP